MPYGKEKSFEPERDCGTRKVYNAPGIASSSAPVDKELGLCNGNPKPSKQKDFEN